MKQKKKSDFSSPFSPSFPNLYDRLKVLAVVTMIIDHIGYYLFPQVLVLRLIGRVAFPIFLFLVGFNASFRWRWKLLFCALFLQGAMQFWWNAFSLPGFAVGNILLVILISRVLLSLVSKLSKLSLVIYVFSLLIFSVFYTSWWAALTVLVQKVFDYGPLGFFFAFCGYFLRKASNSGERVISVFSLIRLLYLLLTSNIQVFGFATLSSQIFLFFAYAILTVIFLLQAYLSTKNKNLTFDFGCFVNQVFLFISRKALDIYRIHIVILLIISFCMKN